MILDLSLATFLQIIQLHSMFLLLLHFWMCSLKSWYELQHWSCSLCWKAKAENTVRWFIVREKHCSFAKIVRLIRQANIAIYRLLSLFFISDDKIMSRPVWNVGYETRKILKGAKQFNLLKTWILFHLFFLMHNASARWVPVRFSLKHGAVSFCILSSGTYSRVAARHTTYCILCRVSYFCWI